MDNSVQHFFMCILMAICIVSLEKYLLKNLLFLYSMFIYLFLTVLSLYHCTGFSLVADSRGYILVAERELLLAVDSLVVEHGLWGTWA